MGKGSYAGAHTVIDTSRRKPTKRYLRSKEFKEHLDELKGLYIRMQSVGNPTHVDVERMKQLLRFVTYNPVNLSEEKDLLCAEDYFVQMVVTYLNGIGHKPPKIFTGDVAFSKLRVLREEQRIKKGSDTPPKKSIHAELDEIESKYIVEAKRFTRPQLATQIEQMRVQARTDQSLRYKLTIFQEVYKKSR